jgi:hypothetical protein
MALSTEMLIKGILGKDESPEYKAGKLGEFMIWKKEDIIKAINDFGTNHIGQSLILKRLWRKDYGF